MMCNGLLIKSKNYFHDINSLYASTIQFSINNGNYGILYIDNVCVYNF